jgi:hypothetical protein
MGVLSHLTWRFSTSGENLATEALAYVLQSSPAARQALHRYASGLAGRELELVRFETQAANEDQSRPDLIGQTAGGERRLLMEVKFWAGLTDAQPVGYLASMTTPGVLLFVAPAVRLQSLWRELLRRVGNAGYALGPEPDRSTETYRISVGDHILALTSWRTLLGFIDADVQAARDAGAAEDLRQLSDLCDRMDTEAFLPLTSEEMTGNLGRRIMQFGEIASELTDILVQRGYADVKGLKATSRPGAYGRYLRLVGRNAYLHFGATRWSKYGCSPIWLSFYDADYPATAAALRAADQQVFEDEGQCHIPIGLPTGVERGEVIDVAMTQLDAIAATLPAGRTHAEAPPPEAVS